MTDVPSEPDWTPLQFSLGTSLLCMAFIAVACGAAKCVFEKLHGWPISGDFLSGMVMFLIPGLVCGCMGIVRGRIRFWLVYAIALDLLILGLIVLLNRSAS